VKLPIGRHALQQHKQEALLARSVCCWLFWCAEASNASRVTTSLGRRVFLSSIVILSMSRESGSLQLQSPI
jgi:hypothetical protein